MAEAALDYDGLEAGLAEALGALDDVHLEVVGRTAQRRHARQPHHRRPRRPSPKQQGLDE